MIDQKPKRSYRLREPITASAEQRIKVGLYLLPSLYQRVKHRALNRRQTIYEYVEDALQNSLSQMEDFN